MVNGKKVGIGITTYNRPFYLIECLEHLLSNATSADYITIYNDGSTTPGYDKIFKNLVRSGKPPISITSPSENKGVAHAKNFLLKDMLDSGCDYLFIIEDDILLLDNMAITEYIRVAQDFGYGHLMFAHHGPANASGPVHSSGDIEYYPACVGAWTFYSAESLKKLEQLETGKKTYDGKLFPYPGFMDENFKNAWEHVEHTKRMGDYCLTGMFGNFPDVKGSRDWLSEIVGSIDNSSIRPREDWTQNRIDGFNYWAKKDAEMPKISLPDDIKVQGANP